MTDHRDSTPVTVAQAAAYTGADLATLTRKVADAGLTPLTDVDGVRWYRAGEVIEVVLSAGLPTPLADALAAV